MATSPEDELARQELRHRLPTLSEVLGRRTLSPVDLFSFYIYMRDTQRSVDYLDFWLDVTQHMTLCRHFVAELRRSVLYETPDMEKSASKRSSQILDTFEDPTELNGRTQSLRSDAAEKSIDQRVSAFLRNDRDGPNNSSGSRNGHKPSNSGDNSMSRSRSRPDTSGRPQTSDTGEAMPRSSFMSSNFGQEHSPGQDSTPPHHSVTRQDLRSSAEKILYTYLLEGAEREIVLPPSILNDVVHAIEEDGRDDPEVFATAREYVFQAMERDAFPGFLRSKALGNLVPPSILVRLVLGLVGMFAAFWAAFVLIFLDKSRATRCWVCRSPMVHRLAFANSHLRSSCLLRLVCTIWLATSTPSTLFWPSLDTANKRSSISARYESHSSGLSSPSDR